MKIEEMKQRLIEAYPDANPSDIQVFDLTGTSDHWEVAVSSKQFAGLSRIEQHQHVMKAFAAELKTGEVHALSIKTTIKELPTARITFDYEIYNQKNELLNEGTTTLVFVDMKTNKPRSAPESFIDKIKIFF